MRGPLVQDVTESLSLLGESAELLRQVDDTTRAANLVAFLEAIGLRAAQFDERVARLAPFAAAHLADVANDLSDAAETLATRWDGLVEARRRALVDVLLTRKAELTALLDAVAQTATATADQAASAPSRLPTTPRPAAAHTAKDAAKAWDEWTLRPSRESAQVFMRLSQSWVEGTGAQLARDERSPSSGSSSATEMMARIRHHLALLAAAPPMPYMDALTTARRRVVEDVHAGVSAP
jgi:hypothetical protein